MRSKCLGWLFACFCLFGVSSYAQDSMNVSCVNRILHAWEWEVRSSTYWDNTVYILSDRQAHGMRCGIAIFDVSNPEKPEQVNYLTIIEGTSQKIEAHNRFLYMLCSSSVRIFDLRDPLRPSYIGIIDGLENSAYMLCSGDNLIISDSTGEVKLYDITDPVNYWLTDTYNLESTVLDLCAEGDRVYSVSGEEIKILDISDQENIILAGSTESNATTCVTQNNMIFAGAGPRGLVQLIDANNPEEILIVDTLAFDIYFMSMSQANSLNIISNYLFVFCDLSHYDHRYDYYYVTQSCKIYDIRDITDIYQYLLMDNSNFSPKDCDEEGYFYDQYGIYRVHQGYRFVEVANLGSPSLSDNFVIDNERLYLANSYEEHIDYRYYCNGIKILDISDPTDIGYLGALHISHPQDKIVVESDICYFQTYFSSGYINIVDFEDPDLPEELGRFRTSEFPITKRGDYIFGIRQSIDNPSLLKILNVARPENIQELDYALPLSSYAFAERGDFLYFPSDSGLIILDVAEPSSPQVVDTVFIEGLSQKFDISPEFLITAHYDRRNEEYNRVLEIYDFVSQENPLHLASFEMPYPVVNLKIHDNFVLVSVNTDDDYQTGGFYVLDISEPEDRNIIGYYLTNGVPRKLAVYGSYVFAALHEYIGIYDCSDFLSYKDGSKDMLTPSAIFLSPAFPNPFNGSTTLNYTVPYTRDLTIAVYSPSGAMIEKLFTGNMVSGHHSITWDATHLPSGSYFVSLEDLNGNRTSRLVNLIK